MKTEVDTVQLAALLADRLRLVSLDLAPIDVKCAWPVFKATAADGAPLFVKLADPARARQTRARTSAEDSA